MNFAMRRNTVVVLTKHGLDTSGKRMAIRAEVNPMSELGQKYALRALTERPGCPTLLPFELGAASGSLGSERAFAAPGTNGGSADKAVIRPKHSDDWS